MNHGSVVISPLLPTFAIMEVKLIFIIALHVSVALSKFNIPCENNQKYLKLGICIVSNVQYDDFTNLTENSFPNATDFEFRNINVPYFGLHLFHRISGDTKQLTFRDGYLREILVASSSEIERLRVLNTDLVTLDAVSEPNQVLKELSVRSPVFSTWSMSLRHLKALELIDVAHCNFSYLSMNWFEEYDRLRVLDVSKNRLRTIHSRPGLVMSTLEELYLWGNRLEFVWRFPDAFPNVSLVNLSDNRWSCSWVTLAREAIYERSIVMIDSDYSCDEGWVNNGGLCCRLHDDVKVKPVNGGRNSQRDSSSSSWMVLADYILDEWNDTVIGVRMGNSVVYSAKPLS